MSNSNPGAGSPKLLGGNLSSADFDKLVPRRIPLAEVVFNQATAVPGTKIMMTTVVPMESRLVGGEQFTCPQPYLDTLRNAVVIEDRVYPLSRVHYWVEAKMAKQKPDPHPDLNQYTVGPRRIVVTPAK